MWKSMEEKTRINCCKLIEIFLALRSLSVEYRIYFFDITPSKIHYFCIFKI